MSEIATQQKSIVTTNIIEPKKFKVIILNDDKTPMDFVIAMMIRVFKHNHSSAEALTMKIHHEGAAVAGIYSYEIAEQKVVEATHLAREHGFPLVIKVEPE
jgi:ATP-dependent Clp protease adaptor protein ClpS